MKPMLTCLTTLPRPQAEKVREMLQLPEIGVDDDAYVGTCERCGCDVWVNPRATLAIRTVHRQEPELVCLPEAILMIVDTFDATGLPPEVIGALKIEAPPTSRNPAEPS